jgi:hypothetical protein
MTASCNNGARFLLGSCSIICVSCAISGGTNLNATRRPSWECASYTKPMPSEPNLRRTL